MPIYLDYHSHSLMDPRVAATLSRAYAAYDANPHSMHAPGEGARRAVEVAREEVAARIEAETGEIIFTSGATEANNLALFGLRRHLEKIGRPRILVSAGEHPSVLAAAEAMAPGQVERVPLQRDGLLDMAALDRLLGSDVGMVSVAAANHEIGALQPLPEISRRVRDAGALLHSDLAQATAWLEINAGHFDLASLSAHKMGGPIGIGALYIARSLRRRLFPVLHGGGQEAGARAGTLSPPLCAAFGEAARIAKGEYSANSARIANLRDQFWKRLESAGGAVVHGGTDRLPGNLNVGFEGVDGEALVLHLHGAVAVSTGSACTSASLEPSHVLTAIGLDAEAASQALRFGLGPRTTEAEIDEAATAVLAAVAALRTLRRRVA